MIRTIQLTCNPVEHDDSTSENEMRNLCPAFFRTQHGKREHISAYRGFLIVRNTVQFSGSFGRPGKPERKTTLYIFLRNLEGHADTLHINDAGNSVRAAKARVDWILANGKLHEEETP